jgi:hypothetical protein
VGIYVRVRPKEHESRFDVQEFLLEHPDGRPRAPEEESSPASRMRILSA